MTIAKFRISSYFAQITSVAICFRKYHSKVLMRFSFFEIEESSKIAINGRKLGIFFSLVQINAMISINILWVAHSAFLAVYKAVI